MLANMFDPPPSSDEDEDKEDSQGDSSSHLSCDPVVNGGAAAGAGVSLQESTQSNQATANFLQMPSPEGGVESEVVLSIPEFRQFSKQGITGRTKKTLFVVRVRTFDGAKIIYKRMKHFRHLDEFIRNRRDKNFPYSLPPTKGAFGSTTTKEELEARRDKLEKYLQGAGIHRTLHDVLQYWLGVDEPDWVLGSSTAQGFHSRQNSHISPVRSKKSSAGHAGQETRRARLKANSSPAASTGLQQQQQQLVWLPGQDTCLPHLLTLSPLTIVPRRYQNPKRVHFQPRETFWERATDNKCCGAPRMRVAPTSLAQ
mmetsp:Transcript_35879/g.70502  ORF Transcript_35879/g.70502 Transcript_35879/m.70502 type:complete len:312 (-) Transcript_35879:343-1278(-)